MRRYSSSSDETSGSNSDSIEEADMIESDIDDPNMLCQSYSVIRSLIDPRAWFDRDRLDMDVEEIIYWYDPKKSFSIFASSLGFLTAAVHMSLISVVAYTLLLLLGTCIVYRFFYPFEQWMHSRHIQFDHPFPDSFLPATVLSNWLTDHSIIVIAELNNLITMLTRLILVQNVLESIKFGAFLNACIILGSYLNFLTLVTYMIIAMCSLPILYDSNKDRMKRLKRSIKSKYGNFKKYVSLPKHYKVRAVDDNQ